MNTNNSAYCEWRERAAQEGWDIDCGRFVSWLEEPNADDFKYCPWCGFTINMIDYCESDDD